MKKLLFLFILAFSTLLISACSSSATPDASIIQDEDHHEGETNVVPHEEEDSTTLPHDDEGTAPHGHEETIPHDDSDQPPHRH